MIINRNLFCILLLGPGPEIKYLLETYCWARIGNKKTYRQSLGGTFFSFWGQACVK